MTDLEFVPTPLSELGEERIGQFHRGAGDAEREAAIEQYPRSGTGRLRVLESIATHGPATDEEVSIRLGMRLYTAAPRRYELVRDGWLRDSGKRRRTTTGKRATVWELTDAGRDAWRERAA